MYIFLFQFEDLYNSFGNDKTSRTFATLVLVSLILFGTITMINLFTVVIISNLKNLEKDVFVQNLSNMAQCAIIAEAILPNRLLKGCVPCLVQTGAIEVQMCVLNVHVKFFLSSLLLLYLMFLSEHAKLLTNVMSELLNTF